MRFAALLRRIAKMEPGPEYTEPWPPDVEGSLSKLLYDQMIAEGVEMPVERPGKDILMCLLKLDAPRVWGDYAEACGS